MTRFTVDTHLFRELGELLVGRDSTALVELIKNSYDADATEVVVYARDLDDPVVGLIEVADDGTGMTESEFEAGFLRVAARTKEQGDRRSVRFKRRFTGAKGIGRLAAHKLARVVEVRSVPSDRRTTEDGVTARINWDLVEQYSTLDLVGEDAVSVRKASAGRGTESGTTITLRDLRKRWTPSERGRFLAEVHTFQPPSVLAAELPQGVVAAPMLFPKPTIRDAAGRDPGFRVLLEGDFSGGDDYWNAVSQAATWVIEINASESRGDVEYAIAPTRRTTTENPSAKPGRYRVPHPSPQRGPWFQGRILVREGALSGPAAMKTWARSAAGVRVFLEGFRVLPYGEPSNDWLSIDFDYTRRSRALPFLDGLDVPQPASQDRNAPLVLLPGSNYFGGIFLTEAGAESLRLLVNREGFVPEGSYEDLVRLTRVGVDLSVRLRASASQETRRARREKRASRGDEPGGASTAARLERAIGSAVLMAEEARALVATGAYSAATRSIVAATERLVEAQGLSRDLVSETAMLRVVASVGTQMAAFVHELNGLVTAAQTADSALSDLRERADLPRAARTELGNMHRVLGDLRRSLERQATYLVDVVTPDARRRRSRQKLRDRFDSASRLVQQEALQREVRILNAIPDDLRSPPMFPAEVTAVFANLLTNAVKAAGQKGRIRARGRSGKEAVSVTIENTGAAVSLDEAERWFLPFESTTTTVDPVLGQGMGLGLPITRRIVEEYGGEVIFARPATGYATAVRLTLPE